MQHISTGKTVPVANSLTQLAGAPHRSAGDIQDV